jgi:hypothetical protein
MRSSLWRMSSERTLCTLFSCIWRGVARIAISIHAVHLRTLHDHLRLPRWSSGLLGRAIYWRDSAASMSAALLLSASPALRCLASLRRSRQRSLRAMFILRAVLAMPATLPATFADIFSWWTRWRLSRCSMGEGRAAAVMRHCAGRYEGGDGHSLL